MKQLLLSIAMLCSIAALAQTNYVNRLEVKTSIKLGTRTVTEISDDTTATNQSHTKLVTEYAVKKLIVSRLESFTGGGGSSAWADITGKPTTLSGYGITDAASSSHTHTFSSLTSKPTTLSGYGITDAASSSHTHTFSSLTSKPTTLSGYGITDAVASATTVNGKALTSNITLASKDISYPTVASLTDGATITWDYSTSYSSTVTLGGNRTLAITNMVANTFGVIKVIQDGTGGRTLTLPAGSKTSGGTLTLSSAASTVDILTFWYDGTNINWTIQYDVK